VIADQQRTADFYHQVGLIKQPLDVRPTFDTGFGTNA
jgi:sulfonate transport system substrate-binding protein